MKSKEGEFMPAVEAGYCGLLNTQWWNNNSGTPLNNFFSTGALSKTTQTFQWTETIKLK